MARLLRGLRWVVLLGVVGLVLTSADALVAGIIGVVSTARDLLSGEAGTDVHLVHAIDLFLIAASALMVAVGLYEIFVGPADVPAALRSHGLQRLKSNVAALLVLVVAVDFVQHFVEWQDARETLEHAIAATLFIGAMVAFLRWGVHARREPPREEPPGDRQQTQPK